MFDIRCNTHVQLQGTISLHVIVNIIKLKRMHGLNYLSFGEQRLLFCNKKYTDRRSTFCKRRIKVKRKSSISVAHALLRIRRKRRVLSSIS